MKRSEIVNDIERVIKIILPDSRIPMLADRGQPDLFIGECFMYNSFSVYDYEWVVGFSRFRLSEKGKIAFVKTRIKEMLCEARDKINKDIERIENGPAKT